MSGCNGQWQSYVQQLSRRSTARISESGGYLEEPHRRSKGPGRHDLQLVNVSRKNKHFKSAPIKFYDFKKFFLVGQVKKIYS